MLEVMLGAAGGSSERVSFTVTPNATSFNSGNDIEFTVTPSHHIVGHEYSWSIAGSIPEELVDGSMEGSLTFKGQGPETVTITTKVDDFKEGQETLVLQMHPAPGNSVVVGESPEVRIIYETVPTGEYLQVAPESRSWKVPEEVTRISVVCVGGGQGADGVALGKGGTGGDLRWRNDIPVTPGETLTVIVGAGGTDSEDLAVRRGQSSYLKRGDTVLLCAGGGGTVDSSRLSSTIGGGDGARGGLGGEEGPGGGGGAGGYSGNGGVGGNRLVEAQPGSGGGGGGGSYYETETNGSRHGTSGGGVGMYGQGENGAAAIKNDSTSGGGGGSDGEDGTWLVTGIYGGGARGRSSNFPFGAIDGGNGAVRIIWGAGRAFPDSRTGQIVAEAE